MDNKNSFFEKDVHLVGRLFRISSNNEISTCQCWAKLNDLWKACQRSKISRYR